MEAVLSLSANLKAKLAVCATSAALAASVGTPAAAYQIDCAILICLSGGWPASAECSAARAEFVRRITPYPIEPPLQIWRCDMSAQKVSAPSPGTAFQRLWDIAAREREATPQPAILTYLEQDSPTPDGMLQLVNDNPYSESNGQANVDISAPAFDFVRSIRVFSVERMSQRTNKDGDCIQSQRVRVGRYGVQGDFAWHGSNPSELPAAHTTAGLWDTRNCTQLYNRSVFVEWRDYAGNYGFEQVDY